MSDIKDQILKLFKEQEKEIKKLRKALKIITDNFPEDVLDDQLGEEHENFKKLIYVKPKIHRTRTKR
jgi:hypothetical protein